MRNSCVSLSSMILFLSRHVYLIPPPPAPPELVLCRFSIKVDSAGLRYNLLVFLAGESGGGRFASKAPPSGTGGGVRIGSGSGGIARGIGGGGGSAGTSVRVTGRDQSQTLGELLLFVLQTFPKFFLGMAIDSADAQGAPTDVGIGGGGGMAPVDADVGGAGAAACSSDDWNAAGGGRGGGMGDRLAGVEMAGEVYPVEAAQAPPIYYGSPGESGRGGGGFNSQPLPMGAPLASAGPSSGAWSNANSSTSGADGRGGGLRDSNDSSAGSGVTSEETDGGRVKTAAADNVVLGSPPPRGGDGGGPTSSNASVSPGGGPAMMAARGGEDWPQLVGTPNRNRRRIGATGDDSPSNSASPASGAGAPRTPGTPVHTSPNVGEQETGCSPCSPAGAAATTGLRELEEQGGPSQRQHNVWGVVAHDGSGEGDSGVWGGQNGGAIARLSWDLDSPVSAGERRGGGANIEADEMTRRNGLRAVEQGPARALRFTDDNEEGGCDGDDGGGQEGNNKAVDGSWPSLSATPTQGTTLNEQASQPSTEQLSESAPEASWPMEQVGGTDANTTVAVTAAAAAAATGGPGPVPGPVVSDAPGMASSLPAVALKEATRSLCNLYACHGAPAAGGEAASAADLPERLQPLASAGSTLCQIWPPAAAILLRRLLGTWPSGGAKREVAYLRLIAGIACAAPPVEVMCPGSRVPLMLFRRLSQCINSPNTKVRSWEGMAEEGGGEGPGSEPTRIWFRL